MKNTSLILAASLACLAGAATLTQAAEVLRLEFENSDLTIDTSGAGAVGVIDYNGAFGDVVPAADARPGSSGSSSANFIADAASDGAYIGFATDQFPNFTPDDDFTVSLWVKPTAAFVEDTTGFRGIVSAVSEENFANLDWQIDNGDTVGDGEDPTVARVWSGSRTDLSSMDLVAGQWQEIIVSYHAGVRTLVTHLDGVLTGGRVLPGGLSMERFLVGANRNLTLVYDGLVDDLVVEDTAGVFSGGVGHAFGDLDFDGDVDDGDWTAFRIGQGADLSLSTFAEAYQSGDVDLDGDNDIDDFIRFKELYNAENGAGALERLLAAPEPTSLLLGGVFVCAAAFVRRRKGRAVATRSTTGSDPHNENPMQQHRPLVLAAILSVSLLGGQSFAQTTVFSAGFEGGLVAADTGTLSFSGPGVQAIVQATNASTSTNWGSNALLADRSANSGGEPGFVMNWEFTNPVALEGASINFDYILRRINTSGVKSHFVTGFDSGNRELFSLMLVDREDDGLGNIADYLDNMTDTTERQRQTVAYVDPIAGQSLFAAADLASGTIPDSNDRTDGANSFQFFIGRENSDTVVSDEFASAFNVTLSNSGWTLDAKGFEGSVLDDFVTNEFAFSNESVVDLARIEVSAQTVQAGGYWDNFSVTGDLVAPPEPLTLQVYSNGEVRLIGGSPGGASSATGIEIDALQISSADAEEDGGSLNPAGFTGLAGAGGFPVGDGTGNGWESGLANSATFIAESFLTGASTILNDADISLGSAFLPGAAEDLSFVYHIAGEAASTVGLVEYIEAPVQSGDFNGDGVVDVADYTVWRDNLGGDESTINSAGDGMNGVDIQDYLLWRTNFGEGLPGAVTAAPEPGAVALLTLTLAGWFGGRRRLC